MFIDGGAGQVAQAVEVARGLSFTFPIVGVSKGSDHRPGEEVLIVDDGQRTLRPGPASPALHLTQAIRDESHRFALRSHQQRRDNARMRSPSEGIPGVGPERRKSPADRFWRALGTPKGLGRRTDTGAWHRLICCDADTLAASQGSVSQECELRVARF